MTNVIEFPRHIVSNVEAAERRRVIELAKEWLGTPFHDHGAVKGAGVDCLMFLHEVYKESGVTGDVQIPNYSSQWMLHRDEELYLEGLQRHCREVANPQMGDIALFRFGRTYSHAGIVIVWPHEMIHSFCVRGVQLSDPSIDASLKPRIRTARFFSPWKAD